MSEKIIVEWWGHPKIAEIDDFVESNLDRECINNYFDQFNAVHISDWKPEITRWIEERQEALTEIQEMVDELPDEEHEEYELDDDEVRGLEPKVIK